MKTIRNRPSLASLGGSDPPDALFSAHKKMVMNYPVTILPLLAYAKIFVMCKKNAAQMAAGVLVFCVYD